MAGVDWPAMAGDADFRGFPRDAIRFMAELAENNDRSWFQPRKGDFERLVKEPMEDLCLALADRFGERGIPLQADPKRSPFRIYRDTRFSHDKAPYKTNVAANFPWIDFDAETGERIDASAHGNGGYFNFQPGQSYLGGGMWMPERPRLEAFRDAVVNEPERVRAALEDDEFRAHFPDGAHTHESLKRVPSGYPPDHPLADLFRWKDVIFGRPLSDDEVCSPDLPDLIADGFGAAMPVFRFLATVRGA